MMTKKHLTINKAWCKGCGICVAFCPTSALCLVDETVQLDAEKCIQCGLCELYCPDYAVFLEEGSVASI